MARCRSSTATRASGSCRSTCEPTGVDFYASGGLKWMLGGTGITFLYARAETTHDLAADGERLVCAP